MNLGGCEETVGTYISMKVLDRIVNAYVNTAAKPERAEAKENKNLLDFCDWLKAIKVLSIRITYTLQICSATYIFSTG